MSLHIYLDNNVWDFLFDNRIDLAAEFPRPEFLLFITREAEFEIPGIPDQKREFVRSTIKCCEVTTVSYFGFFDSQYSADEQRVAGWGNGEWVSASEREFIESQQHRRGKTRSTGLKKEEADIALAARGFRPKTLVLSFDRKGGPLPEARRRGANIVFLNNFSAHHASLREFVLAEYGACSSSV